MDAGINFHVEFAVSLGGNGAWLQKLMKLFDVLLVRLSQVESAH
jgi:hypothetical protein